MKLPVTTKLSGALSKVADSRFATHCAAIRDGNLFATNGKTACIYRDATPGTPDCLLSPETVAAIDKAKGKEVVISDKTTRIGSVQYDHATESDYPSSWDKVIPKDRTGDIELHIDTALLLKLAKAMGSDVVTLSINKDDRTLAIGVATKYADGAIMPVTKME